LDAKQNSFSGPRPGPSSPPPPFSFSSQSETRICSYTAFKPSPLRTPPV
jgi:hypothetical protein